MTSTITAGEPRNAAARSRFRILGATSVGNALEWFDWQIYATFAPFIATQLFDAANPVSSLLQTFAVFAVGFLARPLGGVLFGLLADRRGRKASLVLAIIAASLGSLMIGLIPTHAAIGAWAAVLLLVARLVQGLAHGGEMPAAQTYLSEMAPPERRGRWASLIYVSGTTGILAATIFGAVLTGTLDAEFMADYGWRIPFVVAAVLGLFALVMRVGLHETSAFETSRIRTVQGERQPALMSAPKAALIVILVTIGATVSFYVWGVTAPAFATANLGMEPSAALWGGAVGTIVFILALPLWGMLSDRIGRRAVLAISMFGTAATFFPMRAIMTDEVWTLILATSVTLVFLSGSLAILPAVYSELFPTHIRTIGTAIPYGIAVALFGGTAPYLQTWFTAELGQSWLFTLYAVVLLVVSGLAALLLLPETRGRRLE
ncbi:MFS transporter [Gulosibacter sp. 10]|uniref:MFS transporter n=1 Tax=Gulosibacter sp. 10 TaxID=1255570 RepID=UPI00097EC094|nr:MFS transporter [Gulosibacter sp. 10]SJM63681.1 L-Proline/Glycine betaine transporter ProP [Gulosibacter sp. 10]